MPALRPGMFRSAIDSVGAFRRSVERVRPGYICVPFADGLSQMLGAARPLGSRRWKRGAEAEALLMRGAFAYPGLALRRRLYAHANWRAATWAPWDAVHHLDPIIVEGARRTGNRLARSITLMPEPVEPPATADRAAARRALGIPEDGRYIGCLGIIDLRKGCDLLVRAFARARLGPADRLLLAGDHDRAIRDLLAGPHAADVRAGRIISLDRFLSPEDFGRAVRAMDLVCATYPEQIGSASTVVRAAGRRAPGDRVHVRMGGLGDQHVFPGAHGERARH